MKAVSFYRDTKGFKKWGMSPHVFNYARARSAGRTYRVSRASFTRCDALEADFAEHSAPRQKLQKCLDLRGWVKKKPTNAGDGWAVGGSPMPHAAPPATRQLRGCHRAAA